MENKYLKPITSYPLLHFSIQITYKAYCSEGYHGPDCSAHCPGFQNKCVVNGQTFCKMGAYCVDK